MKNKIKLSVLFVLIVAICSFSFIVAGCNNKEIEEDSTTYIELSMDNYSYYLSIDTLHTGSTHTAVIRADSYKVTVSGAVNGLYKDCSLFYQIGSGQEREVKLNAAGFATFNYSVSTNSGSFKYVRVKGQIII